MRNAMIIENYYHFSVSLSGDKDTERATPGSLSG
jgi:hypothetical protein